MAETFLESVSLSSFWRSGVRVERSPYPKINKPRGIRYLGYELRASGFFTASLSLMVGAVRSPYIVLSLLTACYCALFQRLRPYDLDNPWFLSFSYNMCREHEDTDKFQQVRFPNGMDGTHLFGRLAASVQCVVLNQTSWLPRDASFVTIVFVIASLGLWWGALRRLSFSSVFVGCFITLLGIWEPIVNMAGQFRYEFFSFFLMSLAFYLATNRLAFPALLVAFLAPETQPAALVACIPTIVVLCAGSLSRGRLILQTMLAGLVGGAAYVWLHPGAIRTMLHTQGGVPWHPFSGGLLSVYFLDHPRHLPEFIVLLVGAAFYAVHRAHILRREIGSGAVLITLFFLFMPHPNAYYMSLALPFPLLAAMLGYQRSKGFVWVLIAGTAFMIGGYAYRVRSNINQGYDARDITKVGESIQKAEATLHLHDESVHIVGDWSLWYAHPHYYLSSSALTKDVERGALYLCGEQDAWKLSNQSIPKQVSCASLRARVPLELVDQLEIRGRKLSLYRRVGDPIDNYLQK